MESRHITHDLAYREAQSRALSEDSPLGVDATDADGACVYTNPKWQAINGLSETQSLGTGWAAAIRPEDKAAVFAQWQTFADSGQTL